MKPTPEHESHFTTQRNKRTEALKAKAKAIEMNKHKTRSIQIEIGLWIQVNDFETPAEIIRQRFIESHQRSQYTSKIGGKNVL